MASVSTAGFRLSSGGLLPRLRQRVRGPQADALPVRREIIALSALTWLPLLVASAVEGDLVGAHVEIPFLVDPEPWVRFLAALPVLVGIRNTIDRSLRTVIRYLETSGAVPEPAHDALEAAVRELERRRDTGWSDAVILPLAFALSLVVALGHPWTGPASQLTSWIRSDGQTLTLGGWWYFLVSMPVLFVVLLRWLWRMVLWAGFLFRVSRLPLDVQPTHPDQCGGLAILSVGQFAFALVFFALTMVASSSLAQDLLYASEDFREVLIRAGEFTAFCVILLLVPLLFFARKMIRAKKRALLAHGSLGITVARAFWRAWLRRPLLEKGGDFLEANAPSAHTDYNSIYETMRKMRLTPIGIRGVALMYAIVFAPFFPLVFTEFSPIVLLQRLGSTLL